MDYNSLKALLSEQVKQTKFINNIVFPNKNKISKEKQITLLESEFTELNKNRDQLKPSAELVKLLNENQKLKYRIRILEQVIDCLNAKITII